MRKLTTLLALCAFICLACNSKNGETDKHEKLSSKSVSLSASGATFPLPFYTLAFQKYTEKTNNRVSYGAIGSGGGIRSLKDETVNFAASDAFLTDEESKEMKPVIHIPTCMGAVVAAFNLDGVEKLRLSGEVLAEIFAGKITKWNDKKLTALNPDIKLPNMKITPVYRSDGSGTTNIFTDYLSKVSSDWKNKFGAGKTVDFPTGMAAKGNPGVAGIINNTKGTIGYIGSEYAFSLKIKSAEIQNSNGEFIAPNTASISAAAAGNIPDDTRTMITNSSAAGAYPISCLTWIVVYRDLNNGKNTLQEAKATVELLQFLVSDAMQAMTESVHYAPLPQQIREKAINNLKKITYNGKKLL